MMRTALALVALAACAGCASAPPAPDDVAVSALPLAPFAAHEACMKLAAGDRLDWRFEANAPVDFNIHYHEGPSVVLPVTRNASFGDAGIYVAAIPHDYCAMWEAGPVGVRLDYRVRRLPPVR